MKSSMPTPMPIPLGASWASGRAPHFNGYNTLPPRQFQQPPSLQHQQQQASGINAAEEDPTVNYAHKPQIESVRALPVPTPLNNPQTFQSAQFKNVMLSNDRRTGQPLHGMGNRGADLMNRVLMALKSGLPDEEDWAVSALMEVSYTDPKVCTFRTHANLAEIILKRIASSCGVEPEGAAPVLLPKENGRAIEEPTLTGRTVKEQQKTLDALLVLRNSSFDPENAQFLARSGLFRRIMIYGIQLPELKAYTEFTLMCLEIIEATSLHMKLDSAEDELLVALLAIFESRSNDRAVIVPALRTLARVLIHDKKEVARSLSPEFLAQVLRYLFVEDDELITASLDFLYQYTAHATNVTKLLTAATATTAGDELAYNNTFLVPHLIRLLRFGVMPPVAEYVRLPRLGPKPVPAKPPTIPAAILDELLLLREPERASKWIQSSYETDAGGEVTQISLWKAYEAQFEAHARAASGVKLLPAVDFIKNVTSAVQNSAAMVVNQEDGTRKFIIKGIVPREVAVSPATVALEAAAARKAKAAAEAAEQQKQQQEQQGQQQGPAFGVAVALVLQNVARTAAGKAQLCHRTGDLVTAALLNPDVQEQVQDLLELVQAPVAAAAAEAEAEVETQTPVNGSGA